MSKKVVSRTKSAARGTAVRKSATSASSKAADSKGKKSASTKVKLLSGGNPQIAKGDGDAPVQAYIAAMPDWKRETGEWLDGLIERTLPGVRKAVKWNSPFYGIDGSAWFLSTHVFTHFVRLTFFNGTALRPVPPGPSKVKDVRYLDIRENERPSDAQMISWVKQAAALPGWSGH